MIERPATARPPVGSTIRVVELPHDRLKEVLNRDVGPVSEIVYASLETFDDPSYQSRVNVCYRVPNPRKGKGQPETITLMHHLYENQL